MTIDKHEIYSLIGRIGKIVVPNRMAKRGRKEFTGKITSVYLDPISEKLEITIGKDSLVFREPCQISKDAEGFLLIYGIETDTRTDEQIFDEMHRLSGTGSDVNDAFGDCHNSPYFIKVTVEKQDDKRRVVRKRKRRKA